MNPQTHTSALGRASRSPSLFIILSRGNKSNGVASKKRMTLYCCENFRNWFYRRSSAFQREQASAVENMLIVSLFNFCWPGPDTTN